VPEIPLPPKVRAILYVIASIAVPVYSIFQVSYANQESGQPLWLSIIGVVVGLLGAVAGVTAVSHVPTTPDA
jgi:membrane protein YdbS with pleckstrin-like domain